MDAGLSELGSSWRAGDVSAYAFGSKLRIDHRAAEYLLQSRPRILFALVRHHAVQHLQPRGCCPHRPRGRQSDQAEWRVCAERLRRGPTFRLSRQGRRAELPSLHGHQTTISAEPYERPEFLSEQKTETGMAGKPRTSPIVLTLSIFSTRAPKPAAMPCISKFGLSRSMPTKRVVSIVVPMTLHHRSLSNRYS